MPSKQTISLCLVVKNEELFIGECLESVRSVADEMIVVDTGSGDRTIDIARAAGAQVFEEAWPGDLGRAHDLPLAHATGDWVLMLDGDEALDLARGPELKKMVQEAAADGFHFTVRNYRFQPGYQHRPVGPSGPQVHGARSWTPSGAIRLFRNRPEFRYEGRLHQTVLDSMKRAGATVAATTTPIHHYGFLRSDREKSRLYTALAAQHSEDRPGDARAMLELGMVHVSAQKFDLALAVLEKAYALENRSESSFFIGIALLGKGLLQEGVSAFHRALAERDSLRFFVDEADIWQYLGQAYMDLGNATEAEKAFRSCLQSRPDSPEAEGRLAATLASLGRLEEAAATAKRLTERYPGLAISWESSGYHALLAGQTDLAIEDFSRAIDIEPGRWSSQFNLALAWARKGDVRRTHVVLGRAHQTDREGRLHGLIGVEPSSFAHANDSLRVGPQGVMSFIPHLSGGAAFVVCELARALAPIHPQIVATLDAGSFTGEAHREELASLGVKVAVVRNGEEMAMLLAKAEPGVVVHHWWPNPIVDTLKRNAGERLVLRSASPLPMPPGYDRYVTLSRFQEQYQKHIPQDIRERIPNGVDLERFGKAAPIEEFWNVFDRSSESRVRIAMISRLDPDKFVRRLLDYLAPLQDLPAVVAIAGRGARRWEIEPELARRDMSRWIRFLGPIPQQQVPGFLTASDIALHLTETHQESHSLSVLQMMAAGLPVVAQPRGCLPEMIDNGETGRLASSELEIAAALRQLTQDPSLRARFGNAARLKVQSYSSSIFGQKWRRLVAAMISGEF